MTIEGKIGPRKITLLQKFEWSLSGEDKITMKVEHETVKRFSKSCGNDLINHTGTLL